MKKNKNIISITLFLFAFIFCVISCERPEIKPEQPETPQQSVDTPSINKYVGTWVRYWESQKDTFKFSNDGTFVYSLGEYLSDGNVYTEEYYYECTDNYLIYYDNPTDWFHYIRYVEFNEDNTLFKLHNFTFFPGPDVDVVYSVYFKKID